MAIAEMSSTCVPSTSTSTSRSKSASSPSTRKRRSKKLQSSTKSMQNGSRSGSQEVKDGTNSELRDSAKSKLSSSKISKLRRIRRHSEFIPSPKEEYAREEPLVSPKRAMSFDGSRSRGRSTGCESHAKSPSGRTSSSGRKKGKDHKSPSMRKKKMDNNSAPSSTSPLLRTQKTYPIPSSHQSPSLLRTKTDTNVSSRKSRSSLRETEALRHIKSLDIQGDEQASSQMLPPLAPMKDDSRNTSVKGGQERTKVRRLKSAEEEMVVKSKSGSPPGDSRAPKSPSTRSRRSAGKTGDKSDNPKVSRRAMRDTKTSASYYSTLATSVETAEPSECSVSEFDLSPTAIPGGHLLMKKAQSALFEKQRRTLTPAEQADMMDDTCHGDSRDLELNITAANTEPGKKRKEGLAVWFGDRPRVTVHAYKEKQKATAKWYSKLDLDKLFVYELRINLLQQGGKKMSLHCCQRGLESQLKEQSMDKSKRRSATFRTRDQRQIGHVKWVKEFQEQLRTYTPTPEQKVMQYDPAEILKRKCRTKTKDDRKLAYQYGLEDAQESKHMHMQDAEYDRVESLLEVGTEKWNSLPIFGSVLSTSNHGNNPSSAGRMGGSERSTRTIFKSGSMRSMGGLLGASFRNNNITSSTHSRQTPQPHLL